jgi:hypothetical protein
LFNFDFNDIIPPTWFFPSDFPTKIFNAFFISLKLAIYCQLEHWGRDFESHLRHGICLRLFCVYIVLCVGSGLAMGWCPVEVSYRLCIGLRNWKSGQVPKGCTAIKRNKCYHLQSWPHSWFYRHVWNHCPAQTTRAHVEILRC